MLKRLMAVTVTAGWMMAGPGAAQEVELGGEIRPRFEVRDPVAGLGTMDFTSMRTRASLSAALEGPVQVFVQFQDVRVFGEEGSTLSDFSADGLDLHQGWVELGDPEADRWSVRVGRQEAVYGGQRLIGAVNWTQQGRAFDGARLRFRPSGALVVDGLAYRLSNSVAVGPDVDASFYGVYSTFDAAGAVDVFGLWSTREGAGADRDVYTVGGRWVTGSDALDGRVEAAYQTGSAGPAGAVQDIAAFMVGGRVGARVRDDLRATLWYDYLSGDGTPGDDTVRVFDTLFATNHKFYGYMDFFLNIPVHTQGRGLQDVALKSAYEVASGQTAAADLHAFFVAAADGLASGHLGEELDLTYRWGYTPGVTFTGGLSYFLAGDAWSAALGRADENQVWGYLMMDVRF